MPNPEKVYNDLISIIIRLAECGLIHGDFNEFNLLIDDDEKVTVIDFPQMTSITHLNASYFFDRDIKGVQEWFKKKFGLSFEGKPTLEIDIEKKKNIDREIRVSGYIKGELEESDMQEFDAVHEHFIDRKEGDELDNVSEEEDETKEGEEEDKKEEAAEDNEEN